MVDKIQNNLISVQTSLKGVCTFLGLFLLCYPVMQAQTSQAIELKEANTSVSILNSNYEDVWDLYFKPTIYQNKNFSPRPSAFSVSYHIDHMTGMFCKMEYKIETKSIISPRFRLGSLNYTNWMEGKGEFYTRYWK
jgi:hypothetical protein